MIVTVTLTHLQYQRQSSNVSWGTHILQTEHSNAVHTPIGVAVVLPPTSFFTKRSTTAGKLSRGRHLVQNISKKLPMQLMVTWYINRITILLLLEYFHIFIIIIQIGYINKVKLLLSEILCIPNATATFEDSIKSFL